MLGFDAPGDLRTRVSWEGPQRTATDADAEADRRDRTALIQDDDARRELAARLADLPVEERFPAYEFLFRDRRAASG